MPEGQNPRHPSSFQSRTSILQPTFFGGTGRRSARKGRDNLRLGHDPCLTRNGSPHKIGTRSEVHRHRRPIARSAAATRRDRDVPADVFLGQRDVRPRFQLRRYRRGKPNLSIQNTERGNALVCEVIQSPTCASMSPPCEGICGFDSVIAHALPDQSASIHLLVSRHDLRDVQSLAGAGACNDSAMRPMPRTSALMYCWLVDENAIARPFW